MQCDSHAADKEDRCYVWQGHNACLLLNALSKAQFYLELCDERAG